MKFQYLGTAAAEAVPAVFCTCEVCRRTRLLGGKNIRTRSQALIDGKVFLDFPADTYFHLIRNNIDLMDVKDILITHVHDDHFYPVEFYYLTPGFSHPDRDYHLNVYGSEDILAPIERSGPKGSSFLRPTAVKPFEPFPAGHLTAVALPAVHGTPHPYFYALTDGEKSVLYCHDSGIPGEIIFGYLKENGWRFDLVSLDCTEGSNESIGYNAHMCLGWDKTMRDKLIASGLADEKTIFVLNHFSHNGKDSLYDDFKEIAAKEGFLTSYDGMEIEL